MSMAFNREHELHRRRFGRNMGLLVVLLAFVALVFGLTVVKISGGDKMEGFDHRAETEGGPKLMRMDGLPPPKNAAPGAVAPGAATQTPPASGAPQASGTPQ
ncbi:hypothetical protein [Paracoccus pacificus]|uniref:Cytochrome C oxidase assembly protein n=1 Tax=Paracoccus pacificus TaxID=1463598 RepID=A0ABW4R8R0_9RHOB